MKSSVKQFASQFGNQQAGLCSILVLLCASQLGLAQQSAPVKPPADQPAATANVLAAAPQARQASTPAQLPALSSLAVRKSLISPAFKEVSETEDSKLPDGAAQGINVHGHWVIDVKNPDGTLAAHREFENSLTGASQGQLLLGGLLSGYYVAGDYAIELGSNICQPAGKCAIIVSQTGQPGSYLCAQGECFATLKYTYNLQPTTGSQIDAYMVMSGSAVPDETGTLDTVATVYNVCDSANGFTGGLTPVLPTGVTPVAPSSCIGTNNSAFISYFTSTTITPSISITSGQSILVTVTISFS